MQNGSTSAISGKPDARAQAGSPPPAANVDPQELAKFQALASRWWDPTGEFKPLHQINPLRLGWIERHCGGSVRGLEAIDVGCGGGILAEALALNGANVTGIDLADKPLTVAELHALDTGTTVRYERIAVEAMAAREPASRDLVTCMEMLEHVPDPSAVVAACAQLAKPGGRLFFSTINRNLKSFVLAILGAEYVLRLLPRGTHDYDKLIRPSELIAAAVLRLLPRGTHDYDKLIRPSELIAAARRAGLEVVDMTGIQYNPLTRTYRLQDGDVDVNYMIALRKPA